MNLFGYAFSDWMICWISLVTISAVIRVVAYIALVKKEQ
jgi:hypothetical protein